MKTAILASSLLCAMPCFGADAESTIGAADCKIVNPAPKTWQRATWSGPCKDGYADGDGIMEWFAAAGTLHFQGTLRRGLRHGQGYTKRPDGAQYEGGYADGEASGKGTELLTDRTEYNGDWRHGQYDGAGAISFATGGAYSGQWKAGHFEGHGKLTYTSGKVFEGEFTQGLPAGQAPLEQPSTSKYYSLDADTTRVGSNIKRATARGPVPFKTPWGAMSKDEQRAVRVQYAALAATDEPPYPLNGSVNIIRALGAVNDRVQARGHLRMLVLVDGSGNGTSVTVLSSPDADMTKVASFAVMKEKYKPALCSGVPCPMIYPFSMEFVGEL